ncbi:MAG: penicillin-binding protein activator LpoB [Desulfobacterales bacterium]|nr:penicillin-binding protein activator LpoB [Desulfobacterales bacterium]
MKNLRINSIIWIVLAVLLFFVAGCSTTTKTYSPDDIVHYDEAYDFSDKKAIVNDLVDSLLSRTNHLTDQPEKPVVIIYGVANRTSEHISTSGITDDIRQELVMSGKFLFLSETQRENIDKELKYEYGPNVAPETRMVRYRQIGAQYLLTGTLRSIDSEEGRGIRVTEKSLKYYSLNMELTDIVTGLITWADSAEIVREASRPIIGW